MQALSKQPVGMSQADAADLVALNDRIRTTERILADLRDKREKKFGCLSDPVGSRNKHIERLISTNQQLQEFLGRWKTQQEKIDREFDQTLAQIASEPQREYSDCI